MIIRCSSFPAAYADCQSAKEHADQNGSDDATQDNLRSKLLDRI